MEQFKEIHLRQMQCGLKPHENGEVISPTQSCILSLSDSFVSENQNFCSQHCAIAERSTTVDSFCSASSFDCDSSAATTPTNTGTIRHRQSSKRDRPLSDTRVNFLDMSKSACFMSTRCSSPNLLSVVEPRHAVRPAPFVSRRGLKHQIERQPSFDDSCDEKQRLLSSPKHSNSCPALKKMSVSAAFYRTDEKTEKENTIKSMRHRNSDTILCGSAKLSNKRVATSTSFIRQLGEKLRAPRRKSSDTSLTGRHSTDHAEKGLTSPKIPSSPAGFEVHRSTTARGACVGPRDSRPFESKGGARAFLIKKPSTMGCMPVSESHQPVPPLLKTKLCGIQAKLDSITGFIKVTGRAM